MCSQKGRKGRPVWSNNDIICLKPTLQKDVHTKCAFGRFEFHKEVVQTNSGKHCCSPEENPFEYDQLVFPLLSFHSVPSVWDYVHRLIVLKTFSLFSNPFL